MVLVTTSWQKSTHDTTFSVYFFFSQSGLLGQLQQLLLWDLHCLCSSPYPSSVVFVFSGTGKISLLSTCSWGRKSGSISASPLDRMSYLLGYQPQIDIVYVCVVCLVIMWPCVLCVHTCTMSVFPPPCFYSCLPDASYDPSLTSLHLFINTHLWSTKGFFSLSLSIWDLQ